MRRFVVAVAFLSALPLFAQSKASPSDKFRQLTEILPTPNESRTASGAPARGYWQQRADYSIRATLDDARQRITATETVTYHNNSPDTLSYLWLQLDNNIFRPGSRAALTATAPSFDKLTYDRFDSMLARQTFDGGLKITSVRDGKGAALRHTIVDTMMRIDLNEPVAAGGTTQFAVDWSHAVNPGKLIGGRGGYELFPKDGNYIYEIAHWFPRMVAYTDCDGWQHKQFLGEGEFTLEFGDYDVEITVPADHIVSATGVLQNPQDVLSAAQRERLERAANSSRPLYIVTPDEAKAAERSKAAGTKTWHFRATNVRDFAFASSRKFAWDAQLHDVNGNKVWAMSFFPNEGNPLWEQYSTKAIIHTLDVYSRFTFDYPYPVAQSVNGPAGGMEYPMISFNGPRPEEDRTYSQRTKYSLIGVVIHEVGHNYFPMTVNSDEREWTWMDEGLNVFLQTLAEREWETGFPSKRGEPRELAEYMASSDQVPIMTSSDSLLQFHNNAYSKASVALQVLRESVLGRELFDFAFKEYARRWKFKRPQPADFFRTMEDASGVDLDWFWRGWFYSTDHTDIAIDQLRLITAETRDPAIDKEQLRKEREERPRTLSQERNDPLKKRIDSDPSLRDFYNGYDELDVTEKDRADYRELIAGLTPRERELLRQDTNFYVVDLRNLGGLVMPVILQVDYEDGTSEELRIPAEIWRKNNSAVSKLILTKKSIRSITLDPHEETADVDTGNNHWPPRPVKSRFQLYKEEKAKNPMQERKP